MRTQYKFIRNKGENSEKNYYIGKILRNEGQNE